MPAGTLKVRIINTNGKESQLIMDQDLQGMEDLNFRITNGSIPKMTFLEHSAVLKVPRGNKLIFEFK